MHALDLQGCRRSLSKIEHNKHLFKLLHLNCLIMSMHAYAYLSSYASNDKRRFVSNDGQYNAEFKEKINQGKW